MKKTIEHDQNKLEELYKKFGVYNNMGTELIDAMEEYAEHVHAIETIAQAGEIEHGEKPSFYEKHQNIIDFLAFVLLCIAGYFLAVVVAL